MNSDLNMALRLLGAAIVMSVVSKPRMDAMGLIMTVAMPLTGVVTIAQTTAGLADSSCIVLAALFVVGASLPRAGVTRSISDRIIRTAGGDGVRVIALIMVTKALPGILMGATGIIAPVVPIAQRIAQRTLLGAPMRPLSGVLASFVRNGTLTVLDAGGAAHRFGGAVPGPVVVVRLHDRAVERRPALNPELAACEARMDGTLTVEHGGSVHDLLTLFSGNREGLGAHSSQKLVRRARQAVRRWQQANPIARSAVNARHHCGIGTEPHRLFLDEGLNYSWASLKGPDNETLEQAQADKLRRIVVKLGLSPGMTVAEIGSGWGSLAIAMARAGARVTAINLARDRIAISRRRIAKAGVVDRVTVAEQDWRQLCGGLDRVVSVGMTEHVGIGQFGAYFGKGKGLLARRGYALIHRIGRMTPPGTTGPFIRKHISRAAMCPRCRRCSRPPSARASGSPTWRCCVCTTTTRSATGGRAPRSVGTRPGR